MQKSQREEEQGIESESPWASAFFLGDLADASAREQPYDDEDCPCHLNSPIPVTIFGATSIVLGAMGPLWALDWTIVVPSLTALVTKTLFDICDPHASPFSSIARVL
jgi:hypothetical protein